MAENFILEAEPRDDLGKGASRRLRRTGQVPAIIYGAGKEPTSISLNQNALIHHLDNEAFFSHILTVKLGGKEENAILKAVQRHPSKPTVNHIDLQRVSAKEKLRIHVPLHFINEDLSPGVKEGGLITHSIIEVEVQCLPKDLPEFIEVDLSQLEMDGIFHMTDIVAPKAVELVELMHGTDHDQPVASIHLPRGAKEVDEVVEAEASEEGGEA